MSRPEKFSLREWARAASVGCSGQPEASALAALQAGDLTAFSDALGERDGELGATVWLNKGWGPGQTPLLETAVLTPDRARYVEVLVAAGARADLVGGASGLAPLHLVARAGDPASLAVLLTDPGADANVRAADRRGGWGPLHFAAQGSSPGHRACLQLLLGTEEVQVDLRDIGAVQTPLALAVEAGQQASVRLLLEQGADPDLKCGRKTVREYMRESMPGLDPGAVTVLKRKEVMEDLEDKLLSLVKETSRHDTSYLAKLGAFRCLARCVREGGEDRQLGEVLALAAEKGLEQHVALLLRRGAGPNSREQPLLEAACRGHHGVIGVLLADPRTDLAVLKVNTGETVLHMVLKMEQDGVAAGDYEACLAELLQGETRQRAMAAIVNKKDSLGNTALHYATQRWPEQAVTALLELGANIGIKNIWREIPISRIRPETMEKFLDTHCLQSEGDIMQKDFSLRFCYSFLAPDREALPEHLRQREGGRARLRGKMLEDDEDDDLDEEEGEPALPETESLWYMGQSKEHRHLLRHPVITSFLWFKWQRIRKYFNRFSLRLSFSCYIRPARNLRLYLLFVCLLTWYVFRQCGGRSQAETTGLVFPVAFSLLAAATLLHIVRDLVLELRQPNARAGPLFLSSVPEILMVAFIVLVLIFGATILRPAIIFLICILGIVEIFQILVSLKRYVLSIENWIEVIMIVIVSVLLSNEGGNFDLNRSLASIAILLSWAKVITLIGKHPRNNRLNIYVTMFFTVLTSFFYFLIWYGLFIVAFGISFYIMLHTDVEGRVKKEDEYVYFNTTFLSVVKTLTMFVGELEFSDIPIDLESSLAPLNYIFFLSFVFLIVVVLMNLLNGLAVSDTAAIQKQAEIFSHLSRVESISYLESILLGDPFDFLSNVPRLFSWLPPCSLLSQLYKHSRLRSLFLSLGAGNILLFYNFLEMIDQETVRAAKVIVSRREEEGGQDDRLAVLEKQVAKLQEVLEQKMDLLLARDGRPN